MQLCSCIFHKHINYCVALLEVQASWDYTLTETGEWLYTFMPGNFTWLCTIADLDDGVPEQEGHDGLLALTNGEEEIEEHHASGDSMGMNLGGGKGQGKAKGRAKGSAMGKAKGKGKRTTKGKAKAKAKSKGKGKGLQDEDDDGGYESEQHPDEESIPDIEDFTGMGKGKGTSKGTAKGKGKGKGKGNAKGGAKGKGKGKHMGKDSMGLIKGVKQGNYKCSLRHREHSKAYNQKFKELKSAGQSHDQAKMGARAAAKAHVQRMFGC